MGSASVGLKSLLSLAARSGSLKVVECLIQSGASVNSLDEYGHAPIHWAAIGGFLDIMEVLVENGADLNFRTRDSQLALHYALQYEQKEVVDFILNKEGEIDEYASIMLGRIDLIKNFIDNDGFNINQVYNELNGYPISNAINFQQQETIKFLVEAGADIHAVLNSSGDSVLHLLRAVTDVNVFDLLLSFGANINSTNARGRTPLHVAARARGLAVVKRLITLGANVNLVGEDGSTPLGEAAYAQSEQMIECLLLAGSHVNLSNSRGQTPLHAALHRKGGLSCARILITHGVDINASDERGLRAIHLAVAQRDDELVSLLLDHNADIS